MAGRPCVYHHSERSDNLIRKAYSIRNRKERKSLLEKAVLMFGGRTTKSAYYRAIAIGAINPIQQVKTWSRKELEILEDNLEKSTIAIQNNLAKKGFSRSRTAISVMRKRVAGGYTQARIDAGLFSASAVSLLLGTDRKNVVFWIEKGWLKASRSGISSGNNDKWEVRTKDIKEFVKNNASRINGAKCDMVWLVDLLTNHKADSP